MKVRFVLAATICGSLAAAAFGQVTPAAGYTPPNDTPAFKVGSTIFADYTYNESPTAVDADGNTIHNSSFNVSRAYINVTGNLNHLLAYRITPDITRETGVTVEDPVRFDRPALSPEAVERLKGLGYVGP